MLLLYLSQISFWSKYKNKWLKYSLFDSIKDLYKYLHDNSQVTNYLNQVHFFSVEGPLFKVDVQYKSSEFSFQK